MKSSFIYIDAGLINYDTSFDVVKNVISRFSEIPVIILSKYTSVYLGTEYCMKGFKGFIEFPCSPSFLFRRTRKILQLNGDDLLKEEKEIDLSIAGNSFDIFLGESEIVKNLKRNLIRFAATEMPIFLFGETGTGKNLLASAIWKHSARKDKQFLWENIGAIPENLASSTLFGTTAGAFTGARNYPGLFESANHGTVFLDEIECASPDVQKGLLCITRNMECKRVGDHKPYHLDVRIISACNVNLWNLVKEKKFREDLFYRITWLPIRIPSLRERLSDIPILVEDALKKSGKGISANALNHLMNHTWPGNVRELLTCISRASVICSGTRIDVSDIKYNLETDYDPSPVVFPEFQF
ncbi:MAG: sigma 54-interacting transcriptional regulator [Treponemataceae bacterium]|nr:sigma 54-interacting transcriptional regulator [Treponemataceae bacterium]